MVNDIDDTTSPLEGVWMDHQIHQRFYCERHPAKTKADGVTRKLVGFEMIDRGIPRHDYLIKDDAGNTIGKVTSGTQAPSLVKPSAWVIWQQVCRIG